MKTHTKKKKKKGKKNKTKKSQREPKPALASLMLKTNKQAEKQQWQSPEGLWERLCVLQYNAFVLLESDLSDG